MDKSDHVVSAAITSMIELYKRGGHSADIVNTISGITNFV
jgi:hypothetical protein